MAGRSADQEGQATASGSCRVADRGVNSSVNQLSSTGLSWRGSGGERRAVRGYWCPFGQGAVPEGLNAFR
jgi:hypothetical protein